MHARAIERLTDDQLLASIVEAGRAGTELRHSLALEISARVHEMIRALPPERVYEQLTHALMGRHPQLALQALQDTGLLEALLPELHATVDFSQEGDRRHKDVWAHTKTVVWQSVPRPALRWAAVLHDIGKVPTRRFLPGGKVTFHGHAELGAKMFRRGVARRLVFPVEVRDRVAVLIRHHQRPGQYEAGWSDSAVRRFNLELGPAMADLLNLSRADITTKRLSKRKRCLRQISELGRRIRALEAADRQPKPLPPGLGRHLMAAFELPPGRVIGTLRAQLSALFESGALEGGREPEYYIAVVRAQGWLD